MSGPDLTLRLLGAKVGELDDCRRAMAHVRRRFASHVNQDGFLAALKTQERTLIREILALESALKLGVFDCESDPP